MPFNLISKDTQSMFSNLSRGIQPFYSHLMNILFFNPTDEKIYPDKVVSFSLGEGVIGSSLISRFLGKIKLVASKEYALGHDKIPTPSELAKTVLSATSEFKYAKKEIVLSIPSSWVVFKSAVFPSSVKSNIRNVITYELDRLTPFGSDDSYFDYSIISENGNSITVSVIATRSSIVKAYIDELKMSDFTVIYLTSNIPATVSLLNYIEHKKDKIIVNISNNGIATYTVSSSRVIDYKRLVVDSTDDTLLADTLISQIKASQEHLTNKHEVSIYLKGNTQKSSFVERLRLKTSSQLTTLNEVLSMKKIDLNSDALISSFGSGVSYLLSKNEGYNLLSMGFKQSQQRSFTLSILLSVVLLMLIIACFVIPLKTEQKNLESITAVINSKKEDLKKAESLKKSIESLQSEIDTIDSFTNDSMATLDIMKELTTIIPSSTWLTRIRITSKTVEIEGFAENTSGLLTKLEESKLFMNVEFSAPSYRDHSTKMERFTIKMQREDKNDKEKK